MEPGVVVLTVFVLGLYTSVAVFCIKECYDSQKNKIKYTKIQTTSI